MPKVTIDGRDITVPRGTTLLQAAEALGLEVPQMCYHPGLSIVGVCRVCLCQVKGSPKMVPACATEAADGMEVGLYTPESEKARRAVIEFWLLNHPLDCPVCDQGGECPLQDIAFDHGPGTSRLNDAKVKKAKRVDLGPHVVLDEERCILCWRCTRFTQEISGSNQIMLKDRGVYTTVGTPPGVTFDDPYSGNVVDLCPVGALTSHDFRFKSRVWEMASTEGVCTACAVGCNTYVWSKKKDVQRLTARPNLRVNDYWLCDRGRFDLGFVNDANRLRRPRMRVEGTLVEVEWADAVRALAEGLRPAAGKGQNQAAALFAPHLANEEYWAFQKFVRGGLGSNHLSGGRVEALTPARADLMRRRGLDSITGVDRAQAILVVGGDLEATHPVYALRVRKAVRMGAQLFVAAPDPGRLESVAAAAARVPAAEAGVWLHRLGDALRKGGGDGAWASLGQVRDLVLLVNAGDDTPSVAETAESFLGSGPKDSRWRTLVLDAGGNTAGALRLGISPAYFPGFKAITGDAAQLLKTKWGGRVTGAAGLPWAGILDGAGKGTIRSLLLVNAGRPAGWGFTAEEKDQLARAPFVAAFDLFAEEVEAFAHVILPTPSFAETDATFTTPDGRVQLARRNIVPWTPTLLQILHRAAGELGIKMKGPEPIELFRELARDVPGYAGLDYGMASGSGARGDAQLAGAGA
jgi:NADH-quinone oxidoreductase subunit G